MFAIFTWFADWVSYRLFDLTPTTQLGTAVHFFIEDTSKILVLLLVMIYLIALIRSSLDIERVRYYLSGKTRFVGYLAGSVFGAITPFCSCSSIPVFLGFSSGGIPLGITMAFLITSPLVNEIAVLLLISLLGWKLTLMYVGIGIAIGMICGWYLDLIGAERWLQPLAAKTLKKQVAKDAAIHYQQDIQWTLKARHRFAVDEVRVIVGRVWKWVIIGVGVGAALHGFVPDGWIETHLGNGQWWTVPVAVMVGIPLYSNATGVIPIMESLLQNGLPIGTTLAFCMSTVAASVPEFVMLKQVMRWPLLGLLFVMLLTAFTVIGWMFNLSIWNG
jgi:uncharacterized membrane protein YraQ (UPF0718 family)